MIFSLTYISIPGISRIKLLYWFLKRYFSLCCIFMVFTNLFHTEWIPLKPIFNWAIQDLLQVHWKQTNTDTEIISISKVFHFYQPLYLLTYISSGLFEMRIPVGQAHYAVYAELEYVTILLSQLPIAGITDGNQNTELKFKFSWLVSDMPQDKTCNYT